MVLGKSRVEGQRGRGRFGMSLCTRKDTSLFTDYIVRLTSGELMKGISKASRNETQEVLHRHILIHIFHNHSNHLLSSLPSVHPASSDIKPLNRCVDNQ
jgi:hypothetical protein